MSDFTFSLGGIAFQDFEVPERVTGLGGEQMISLKKLIGGARVADSMGRDDTPLEWGGRFRGQDALSRARAIDALRVAGASISLAFGDVLETVLIQRFNYDFERGGFEVPYSISLIVLKDDTSASSGPGVDEMMGIDNGTAQDLSASIGDDQLTGLLGGLDSAISSVSSFATATQSEINSVLTPIAQVQGRVTTLIASAENTLGQATTLGGVLPNNPVARTVASLEGQVTAMTQCASLYDLQNTTGRMAANLAAVGAGGAQVVVAGADLFKMAEQAYGDATEWSTIAKANNLTDPLVSGVQTILVPPVASGSDGLLQAS